MSVFFIADTHFGHANIIKYENRPFTDVSHMTESIIKNWNQAVKKDDKVFHLGDFAFGDKEMITNIVSRLHGHKHLIMGNHDCRNTKWYRDTGFNEVSEFPIIYKEFFMLSHAPLYINENMPYANIFGHVHSSPEYKTVTPQSYCVSIERLGYVPIEFEAMTLAMKNSYPPSPVCDLWDALRCKRMVQSKAEYKRLITQGAITVNGEVKTEMFGELVNVGDVITIGKNRTMTVGK
jgi:calcineurin-like phosphoesterase family protein